MAKERYDIPSEPKAGKVGSIAVVLFGVLYVLMAFIGLYMWFDADFPLAAALGVASIVVPMTVGFFISEVVHQRAGAFWFVITAAVLTGAIGAWALAESENFEARQDILAPGVTLADLEPDS